MKKIVLLSLMLLLPIGMMAEGNHVKVTLTEAGSLQERLLDSGYESIDSLTVCGKFSSVDLKYLRDGTGRIANMVYLDLTDIEIVECEEEYYTWAEFYGAIGHYGPYHHYFLSPTEYTTSEVLGTFNSRATHYYHYSPNFDCAFCADSNMGSIGGASNTVLKEIRLPKNSPKVGEYALNGCSVLEKVVLPESCKTVGQSAFGSKSLETLVNSEKIDSVGAYAFSGTKIKAVFAPLRYVGASAFYGTPIEAISFASGIKEIADNTFCECTNLISLTIPGSAESIGKNAFNGCSGLTKVSMGEGVLYLGDCCFKGCSSATDFTIPSTIVNIGNEAFDGVPLEFEEKDGVFYIGNIAYNISDLVSDIKIREGTTTIAGKSYSTCARWVTKLTLPSTLKSIGEWAFAESSIESLVLPDGLEYIGGAAFSRCANLSSVTIPAGMKVFDEYSDGTGSHDTAFNKCTGLVHVNWNATDCQLKECFSPFEGCSGIEIVDIGEGVKRIPAGCFDSLENLIKVTISSTVEEIGQTGTYSSMYGDDREYYGGFAYCPKLKTVTIAENSQMKLIGNGAFNGCVALTEIAIPANVELIGKSAFQGDYNNGSALEKVTFAQGSKLKEIMSEAFAYCTSLTSIELPEGLTTIGGETYNWGGTFSGCTALATISLPSTLTSVGPDAFYPISNTNRTVYIADLAGYCNISFANRSSSPLSVCNTSSDSFYDSATIYVAGEKMTGSLVIPDGVTSIGSYAFCYCPNITSVTLPSSVKAIDEGAFMCSDNIREVYVQDLTSWCSIQFGPNYANPLTQGYNRYSSNTKSPALVIGGVEEIADDIELPKGVTTINDYAFSGFDRMTSITIPEGVTNIGEGAFYNCPNLKTVTIPKSVTAIDSLAFHLCKNLESVYSYIKEPFEVDEYVFSLTSYYRGTQYLDPNNATLYVPYGTIEKYEALTGWYDYFYDIEEMEEEIETDAVTIGSVMQVPYCSDKNLDFTDKPDLKAYVATGYDKATGTIWLTRVKQVPANTGFLLMGEAGDYDIPVVESVADCYYKNMFKGTISGETIYTTDGDYTNYYLSNGEYGVGFYKVGSSVDLKANRAYLSIPTDIPAAGSEGDTEVIKVGAALQVPYFTSKNLDFSTMDAQGVKAYTATGYNYGTGTIWLTRVKKVPAKTGVLIMADTAGEYSIPTATVSSYYANMFVGSETAQTIYDTETIDGVDYVNYYLSKGEYGVGFYKAKAEGVSMGSNRCYLQVPYRASVSGARGESANEAPAWNDMILYDEGDDIIAIPVYGSINGDDDGTTNVGASLKDNGEMIKEDIWYNLQGQRVDKPGKGIYIHNGVKVVIK